MRIPSPALLGLVLAAAFLASSGAAFLIPSVARRSGRCTTTGVQAASQEGGQQQQEQQHQQLQPQHSRERECGCSRRQTLQVTGALALGASTLLASRPLPAVAAEEGFIFPNVSEPAFGDMCFLEFAEAGKDGKKLGRVEVSLYADIGAPQVRENFVALCAGSSGVSYKGSNVYRVLKDYSIQAGDNGSKKRGASGTSSFGEPFVVDKAGFRVRHSMEGMVSMAGVGKIDSRFFFNLGTDSSWADDRYVAFGRVTKGLEVLKNMEKVDVRAPQNAPIKPIIISDAGVL